MKFKHSILVSLCITCIGLISGCNENDAVPVMDSGTPASLRILHINDHHSHLTANSASLALAGAVTGTRTGGFPGVVSVFKSLESEGGNVLKLHAGDATTGDLYFTLFKGKADAAMMNQICFDAFTLGNHEFDEGDAGLKTFLDFLNNDSSTNPNSCHTPVLSANTLPEVGVSPLTMTSATDYIQPYVVKEIDGQKFGIIGITVAGKTKNSSSPDKTTTFADEVTTAQKYIDELKAQGVNKIILLSHYGYANDMALAPRLDGVDVIVGGDSHSLLGDGFGGYGLSPAGAYPTRLTDNSGKTVCIVQASQYGDVVGDLNVDFDANGDVSSCSGTPHLLLNDTFTRKDNTGATVELTGAERDAVKQVITDSSGLLMLPMPDAAAQSVLDGYSQEVDVLKQTVIGMAGETLCLERIPNGGQSKVAGCKELTKSHGSDISNIVAKGFLEMSLTSDICLQNGGGVRIDVPAGDITIGTAYTLLPFANTLTEINLTGQEIINALEDGIDYALAAIDGRGTGSTGAYPYAAGLRWDADLSKPKGSRVSNVQVNPRVQGGWVNLDPADTYKVVTNNFMAKGSDGYITLGNIPDSRKLDTYLDYAQSFVDYVKRETAAGRNIIKLPVEEYSTQQFIDKDGVLQ